MIKKSIIISIIIVVIVVIALYFLFSNMSVSPQQAVVNNQSVQEVTQTQTASFDTNDNLDQSLQDLNALSK